MSYGGGKSCGRCQKTVYMNEEMLSNNRSYHKRCFQCMSCGKSLDSTNVANHEDEIYCKGCYGKNFGPKGYGYGQGAGTLQMTQGGDQRDKHEESAPYRPSPSNPNQSKLARKFGGADKCPRCGDTVYAAEKVIGAGSAWHKRCFNCADCKKKLDSTTVSDNEGEIYCKGCYGKNFGPKGYGYGGGAGALQYTQ